VAAAGVARAGQAAAGTAMTAARPSGGSEGEGGWTTVALAAAIAVGSEEREERRGKLILVC
jgi:hypothetical protein